MPRLCVIGFPVAHSLSPRIQGAALADLGLAPEWDYGALEVPPDEFEDRVRGLGGEGYVGANVTIPHKLVALALSDSASPAATAIGAANTLSFDGGRISAANTDAEGLIESLPHPLEGARALVLGAGGAGRAAVWALRDAGASVALWNRTAPRAEAVARELGVEPLPSGDVALQDYDLVVNATSVGMAGSDPAGFKEIPIAADQMSDQQTFVDLVYRPGGTELTQMARSAGAAVVDGLEILVRQGAASLRMWTGLEPRIEVMRSAAHSIR